MATTKKRIYNGRNTGMFYAQLSQLPGYDAKYKDVIKDGIINEYLESLYGKSHNRPLSISKMTDMEYEHLLKWLQHQISERRSIDSMQKEAVRKNLIHQILRTFTRINVHVVRDSYDDVNYHIRRIPYSKGRIIPQIPTEELPRMLGAVRGYCDGIRKQQVKERESAYKN